MSCHGFIFLLSTLFWTCCSDVFIWQTYYCSPKIWDPPTFLVTRYVRKYVNCLNSRHFTAFRESGVTLTIRYPNNITGVTSAGSWVSWWWHFRSDDRFLHVVLAQGPSCGSLVATRNLTTNVFYRIWVYPTLGVTLAEYRLPSRGLRSFSSWSPDWWAFIFVVCGTFECLWCTHKRISYCR